MANLYYCEELADADFESGRVVELRGDEARHATRVSRLRAGERTIIGNGAGVLGHGEVVGSDRDRLAVRIERVESFAVAAPQLVLVQALAKGDRDERAVEQATEFGVDRIVPWQAARSVSRWDGNDRAEKAAKGVLKWARIAREAAKQSIRPFIPRVDDPTSLRELCALAGADGVQVLVLHPRGQRRLSEWAGTDEARSSSEIHLVIGPEGGFDEGEIDALESAGAHVLVLGDTVLRTSSAGPAAIAVLNCALGRW